MTEYLSFRFSSADGYWLTFQAAIEMIISRCNAGIGKAQVMLSAARLSKEVRAKRLNPPELSVPPNPDTDGSEQFLYSEDDLVHWLNERAAPINDGKRLGSAPDKEIRTEIRAVYNESGSSPPNINQLPKVVQPRLKARGLDASESRIKEIGNEREFQGRRRPAGRTIASERK